MAHVFVPNRHEVKWPPKMLFIYETHIKRGNMNSWCLRVYYTTTVCVSELNVLLVYTACSKYKYNASEADCSAFSLSLSLSLSML